MHYHFESDLKDAIATEQEVIPRIFDAFPGSVFEGSNHDYRFDLWFTLPSGRPMMVEVKDDLKSFETGNIALEYKSRGKFSDIATSAADIWVFKYRRKGDATPRFIAVQKTKLYRMYRKMEHPKVVGGDPGSDTRMLLIPVEDIERIGRQI